MRAALDLRIEGSRPSEKCVALEAKDGVAYRFESTIAVDFNIHTHRGREVVAPVRHDQVRAHSGTFAADLPGEYCLTWENRSGVPAFVTGEWSVRRR